MYILKKSQNEIIDNALSQTGNKLRVIYHIDPINLRSEKKEFFKRWLNHDVYNPIFRYPKINIDLEKIEYDLKHLNVNTQSPMGKILGKKRERLLLRVNLLKNRGRAKFPYMSYELYGRPPTSLVSYAVRALVKLKNKRCEHKRTVSSKKAVSAFRKALAIHKINWRVKEKRDMAAKAGISSKKNLLAVRRGAVFSKKEVERLIAHEIETHVFRVENGRLQPYSIFANGFPGPETTEEGLAVLNELRYARKDYERRRIIAARTLGVEYAMRYSFFDVFEKLVQFNLHPESVWDICVRAKRGLTNTAQKGSFTRDHHYLKGYLVVKKFKEDGGDLRDLYVGRINVHNVKKIPNLARIVPPRFLPYYLKRY